MKNIITILIIVSCSSIMHAQTITVDSLSKRDLIKSIENRKINDQSTSKNGASTPQTSEYNTQSPDTNRDLFQFNKLQASDVNKVVGKTDVRIPIYSIDFQGLKIPIELVYNSGGIKADQFATEVGLGWTLSAGGEINKDIVKINDSQGLIALYYAQSKVVEYNYGYLAVNTRNSSDPNAFAFSDHKDLPDLYNVNFLNLNSSFYIDNNLNPIQTNPYDKLKISIVHDRYNENFVKSYGMNVHYTQSPCSSNPGLLTVPFYLLGFDLCNNSFKADKEIQKINIIDDHFTYDFNDFSVQIPSNSSNLGYIVDSGPNYTSTHNSGSSNYINRHLISSITDNLTKKKVLFSYSTFSGMNSYVKQGTTFDVQRLGYDGDYQAPPAVVNALNIDYDGYINKNISQIKTDNEIIEFEYINGREDSKSLDIRTDSPTNWNAYNKDPYLSKVYIKDYKGNIKQLYVFNYSYFDSNCTDYNLTYNKEQCYRLKLNSVFKYTDLQMQNLIDSYVFDYYEDKRLPKIGTFHMDSFGYKSPLQESETSYLISDNEFNPTDYPNQMFGKKYSNKRLPKRPNLYRYTENQGGLNFEYYSTLKISALSPTKINSNGYDQALSTLEDSRAWSLKSIQYFTQGLQKFNYELNKFNWKGQEISGAGLRISSIDLIDEGKTYSTKYQYSGGQITNLPLVTNGKYQFPASTWPPDLYVSQNLYGKEIPYNGGTVLYENVTKILPNNGRVVDKYSTIADNPMKVIAKNNSNNTSIDLYNYYFPASSDIFWYLKKQPLIGNPIETNEYDDSNNLIRKTEYTYSLGNKLFPIINSVNIEWGPSHEQDNRIPYSFAYVYNSTVNNINIPAALYSDMTTKTFTPGNDNKLYRNNLIGTKTTDFFNGRSIVKNRLYSYLDSFNLIKSISDYLGDDIYKKDYLYSFEQGDQYNQQMSNDDKVKTMPVGNQEFKNGKLIASDIDKFSYTPSGSVNLIERSKKYTQNETEKTYFSLYDNKGNAVEIKNPVQIPTVFIWGYGQNLLLAKIEGATYAQVMQALSLDPNNSNSYLDLDIVKKSDLHVNDATEGALITSLELFRKKADFKNYKISTYTYSPLIGAKTSYDETGLKTVFKYDSFNRLHQVLSQDGDILKEYKYNSAPRIYYSKEKSQSFTRNNCGGGAGSSYIYTVPQGQYTSIISQADADQQSQNDINSNGQNLANANGTCTNISCNLSFNSGVGIAGGGSVSVQPNSNYKVSFGFSSGANSINLPWTTGVKVATISGICKPVTDYSSYNGQIYYTIKTNGDVILKTHSGSALPNNTSYNYELFFPIN